MISDKQWLKFRLRIQQLLAEKDGIVQLVIVARDGSSVQLQVMGGKTETIPTSE